MSQAQWHKTACNLCYVNCGLEVAVEDGRIAKVRGDKSNPKSQGYLCNKAARIPFYAHHKATADLAAAAAGRRLVRGDPLGDGHRRDRRARAPIHAAHGGQSFALCGGGGQGNHAGGGAYVTGLLRAGIAQHLQCACPGKDRRLLVNGRCWQPDLPHRRGRASLRPVVRAGCNPWIAHGFPNARDHLNHIRKDPGRKLIVVDPRRTETAELADLHLAVQRPGADAFLLAARWPSWCGATVSTGHFSTGTPVGFEQVHDAPCSAFLSKRGPKRPM
jgi:hypothetical protein